MKYVALANDFLTRLLSRKNFLFLFAAIFFCIGVPLLSSAYLSASPADKAMMFETYALNYKKDVTFYLYNFFPIMIGISFAAVYGDSMKKGRDYVFLNGGVTRLHMQTSKWISSLAFHLFVYMATFIIYQAILLIFGFGAFQYSDLLIFFKIFINSIIISLFSIFLINLSKNTLLGILPSILYYMLNFLNSQQQYSGTEKKIYQFFYIFLPILSTNSQYLDSGITPNNLVPIFGFIYVIFYVAIIGVLSYTIYYNADL